MPTLNFLIYLLAVAAAYLFRVTYLGWLGRYLLCAVIVIPPLLFFMSLPSLLRFALTAEITPDCVRGAEAELRLKFRAGAFPVGKVKLKLTVENRFTGEKSVRKLVYPCAGSGERSISLPTADCGTVRCRADRLICRDLLGFISLRRRIDLDLCCAVLPEPEEPETVPDIDAAMSAGVALRPKLGGGYSEEHELRPYRPGDAVNSIHWKLSSKTDNVIVREPLVNANTKIFLVLSDAGDAQQSLSTLYWFSLRLCSLETPHTLVAAGGLYEVGNEAEAKSALSEILSSPMDRPCVFDRSFARCVFSVSGREVRSL